MTTPFAISLIPLEISFPLPLPCLVFFWSSPFEHWLPSYLPTCKLCHFLRGWFAPAVWWNFSMVVNSVYITENLSWFFLFIFDENLTDFIPHIFQLFVRKNSPDPLGILFRKKVLIFWYSEMISNLNLVRIWWFLEYIWCNKALYFIF